MTELDKKIIELISQGKTAKEIGKETNRSRRTIEHRIDRLKKKHNCKSLPQLIHKFAV